MTSEVKNSVTSVAKNALVVSLCYRGQDNYVKGEGTLKDVDIIKGLLLNKFGFNEDEIKVLTEAEATKANFINGRRIAMRPAGDAAPTAQAAAPLATVTSSAAPAATGSRRVVSAVTVCYFRCRSWGSLQADTRAWIRHRTLADTADSSCSMRTQTDPDSVAALIRNVATGCYVVVAAVAIETGVVVVLTPCL